MDQKIAADIKKRVQAGEDENVIKADYLSKGFLEQEIDKAMGAEEKHAKKASPEASKFAAKDFFDTVGYGFSSQQFINIFFLLSGAGYMLIGIINSFRTLLSVFSSSVITGYRRDQSFDRKAMIAGGILLVLTLIGMAFAHQAKNYYLFAGLILLSGIFVAIYGDFYLKLKQKSAVTGAGLMFLQKYSLIITGACLLIVGFALDSVPSFAFGTLMLNNSFLMFGLAGLSILLGLIIIAIYKAPKQSHLEHERFFAHLMAGFAKISIALGTFMKNGITAIMIVSSMTVATIQVLGSSYFGVFIFENLGGIGFGKYLNVAIVFTVAAVTSLFGPVISKLNAKEYGKFPMLVFGTLLMAIMPLTYYYNPNIISICMGTVVGIIGAAISGVAHGLLINDILPETQREDYFSSLGLLSVVPYVITAPVGGYIAQSYGLKPLFLILGIMLVLVVALYFAVVWLYSRRKAKI